MWTAYGPWPWRTGGGVRGMPCGVGSPPRAKWRPSARWRAMPSSIRAIPSRKSPPKGPSLVAEQIAHPLIPEDRAVRNDVRIGGELRLRW